MTECTMPGLSGQDKVKMWSFALAALVVEKGVLWLAVAETMRKGFRGLRKGLVAARNRVAID